MIGDTPADLVAYEAELDSHLVALRKKLESEDPAERETAKRRIFGVESLKTAAPGLRITLPHLLFEDRLVIEGQRRVELLTYGGGHTDSDVFAWLPEDRIVIAGDLCWNKIHPRTQDGHPGAWADILDRMSALKPEKIHPGHGRPGGPEIPQALAPYLRTVAGYIEDGAADPTTLPPPPGSEAWDTPERMRNGVAKLREVR